MTEYIQAMDFCKKSISMNSCHVIIEVSIKLPLQYANAGKKFQM